MRLWLFFLPPLFLRARKRNTPISSSTTPRMITITISTLASELNNEYFVISNDDSTTVAVAEPSAATPELRTSDVSVVLPRFTIESFRLLPLSTPVITRTRRLVPSASTEKVPAEWLSSRMSFAVTLCALRPDTSTRRSAA